MTMAQLFLQIFNMSISASYIVLAVLLLRPLLKKAPKWITVVLWGVVAVRLVCPFSLESVFSLIPSAETVNPGIMTDATPSVHTGVSFLNNAVNPVIGEKLAPTSGDSANPLQVLVPVSAAIWLAGVAAMLLYAAISYMRIERKIGTAVLYRDNIHQSENVASPFVLGLVKPKIYLPFRICEQDMAYVVAHEQAHISRKDYLWKPLGFLLLALHWFNPLMWLGYILLCRDIELACDEKVIQALDRDARADYSQALVTCSVNRHLIAVCPLAFGEVAVKKRVKSVLNYQKPAFWLVIAAVVACVALAVCFLTDPKSEKGQTDPEALRVDQNLMRDRYPQYFDLDASNGLDVYVWQMAQDSYDFALLPHVEPMRDWVFGELFGISGTSAMEMRIILSSYDVSESDIHIIPWQNPFSSYLGEYWVIAEGEDMEAKREAYVAKLRDMLFGDVPQTETAASGVTMVYYAPSYSYVMPATQLPLIEIQDEVLYVRETRYGSVRETTLPYIDFAQRMIGFKEYGDSVTLYEKLLENEAAYEVIPDSPQTIDLYYVVELKNGNTLIVYGHYNEAGERKDEIRWIFEVTPEFYEKYKYYHYITVP